VEPSCASVSTGKRSWNARRRTGATAPRRKAEREERGIPHRSLLAAERLADDPEGDEGVVIVERGEHAGGHVHILERGEGVSGGAPECPPVSLGRLERDGPPEKRHLPGARGAAAPQSRGQLGETDELLVPEPERGTGEGQSEVEGTAPHDVPRGSESDLGRLVAAAERGNGDSGAGRPEKDAVAGELPHRWR